MFWESDKIYIEVYKRFVEMERIRPLTHEENGLMLMIERMIVPNLKKSLAMCRKCGEVDLLEKYRDVYELFGVSLDKSR